MSGCLMLETLSFKYCGWARGVTVISLLSSNQFGYCELSQEVSEHLIIFENSDYIDMSFRLHYCTIVMAVESVSLYVLDTSPEHNSKELASG